MCYEGASGRGVITVTGRGSKFGFNGKPIAFDNFFYFFFWREI